MMNPLEPLTDEDFEKFRGLIYRLSGIHVPPTKRVMVSNRLRKRLRATGIETFARYYAHLTTLAGASEVPRFLDEITTNETYFFRDAHQFRWLADTFLPEAARDVRRKRQGRRLRIWSAACSTGEEPYSIAIRLLERRGMFGMGDWPPVLLGTDLSQSVLEAARAARYDTRALRLATPEERKTFFEADEADGRWTVRPEVRALTEWRTHNLMVPIRDEPFDCIFLKNVLIYFDEASKAVVARNMIKSLAAGGYLVLGPTEVLSKMLDPLERIQGWLYRKPETP